MYRRSAGGGHRLLFAKRPGGLLQHFTLASSPLRHVPLGPRPTACRIMAVPGRFASSGRGRPRKEEAKPEAADKQTVVVRNRGRGRPPKAATEKESKAEIPARSTTSTTKTKIKKTEKTTRSKDKQEKEQQKAKPAVSAAAEQSPSERWAQMTVPDLKKECKLRGLKVGGGKAELIERLKATLPTTDESSTATKGPIIRVILAEKKSAAENIARALGIKKIKKEGSTKETGYIGNVELTSNGVQVIPIDGTEGGATVVTWASGHLFELQKYTTWKLDKLPVLPSEWVFSCKGPAQKRQFEVIRRLFESADEIVNACDAGREGELIFREIFEQTNARAPFKRLWISSLTDEAIKDGFRKLQDGSKYDPLFSSALARTKADWLVGMNATQAYTLSYRPKVPSFQSKESVSLGRVQTPVLRMIVDRWKAVNNFKPEPYWELFLRCRPKGSDEQLRLKYFLPEKDKVAAAHSERFTSEQEAEDVRHMLGPQCTIEQITQKPRIEKPPKLFDLTSLQREANRRFGYTADQTLSALQSLYEVHKLISYPRTDSRYLTPDTFMDINTIVDGLGKQKLFSQVVDDIRSNKRLSVNNRAVFDTSKVSDHHAIIPTTNLPSEKILSHLSPGEQTIYNLIVTRLLSCFMPDCEKRLTELIAVNQSNYLRAKGVITINPGWRSLSSLSSLTAMNRDSNSASTQSSSDTVDDGNDGKEDREHNGDHGEISAIISRLREKDTLECILPAEIIRRETTPPSLLTDSSLLYLMETAGRYLSKRSLFDIDSDAEDGPEESLKEFGIGTPATRAQTIEKLIAAKYVRREEKKLVPTEKGKILIDLLQKIHSSLASPQLTGQWEKRLQDIAKNAASHDAFIEDVKKFTEQIVNEAREGATKLPDFKRMMKTMDQEGDSNQSNTREDGSSSVQSHSNVSLTQYGISEEKEEDLGCSCWKCGKGRMLTRSLWKMWRCSNDSCDFILWKSSCGREMKPEELRELATEGVTQLLSGFKSKAGKPFEARLAINQENKTVFMFPFTKRRGAGASDKRTGFGSRRMSGLPSETDE